MRYSAVIAAKNEEQLLPGCLESLREAAEIILIDDMSTDDTARIGKEAGAKVISRKMDGFANQKNFGIDQAANDWVLIIDADERLTSELVRSIEELDPQAGVAGYQMAFRNHLGKKWLRHGGLYPDWHTRLFDRRLARYGQRQVHEELEINGKIERLSGDMIHLTYADLGEYLKKVRIYSQAQARADKDLGRIGKKRNPYKAMLGEIYFRLLRLKGYKDGWSGLISALLLGHYQFLYWRSI